MPIHSELLDNPHAQRVRFVADLVSRKGRRKSGRFLAEGPQSVREAVRFATEGVRDIYADKAFLEDSSSVIAKIVEEALNAQIYVHPATTEVMAHMSKDCQGILAVVEFSALQGAGIQGGTTAEDIEIPEGSLVAACWQLRDPGNAGTIIRAADAAGCAAVILVDECVDMTNPKVVRSTAGSLFHIPVMHMGTEEFFEYAVKHGVDVVAADAYGTQANPVVELPDAIEAVKNDANVRNRSRAILFGNEARGLDENVINMSAHVVKIPLYGKAESLNVATSAAVLLYSYAMYAK